MIITNSSPDTFYYNQLLAFLASVRINSPDDIVHVFLADYPEDKVEALSVKFPSYKFDNRHIKRIDSRGFSFIQFRVALIKECFERYDEPVAWMDTDIIVRGSLEEFLKVKGYQLKILYRGDDVPDKVKINAGIFNVGCSLNTHAFINEWQRRVEVNAKWGMGQLELWRSYKIHEDNIELIKMSEKFNDLGGVDRPNAFADDSVIWHCKKSHFNHPKFQKEFQYYLKAASQL